MNPTIIALRRPVTTLMLVVALISVGVLAYSRMRVDIFSALNTPKVYVFLDYIFASPLLRASRDHRPDPLAPAISLFTPCPQFLNIACRRRQFGHDCRAMAFMAGHATSLTELTQRW